MPGTARSSRKLAPLLTPYEAAAILRISHSTMYRWIAAGKVPAIRLPSGDVRLDENELAEWLETRSRRAR